VNSVKIPLFSRVIKFWVRRVVCSIDLSNGGEVEALRGAHAERARFFTSLRMTGREKLRAMGREKLRTMESERFRMTMREGLGMARSEPGMKGRVLLEVP
jgi:hypothetical protein